jgi:hypothetical protein
LFGASEQLVAQTPAFQQRAPSGPVWFQRMDRNNDGDLIFNEFFGPLMIFNELDADGDELLDPQKNQSKAANQLTLSSDSTPHQSQPPLPHHQRRRHGRHRSPP